MRALAILGALLLTGCPGFGDKTLAELEGVSDVPTWHTDVRPIIAAYCQTCHKTPTAGGAPFPLLTLEQVRTHAPRIRVRAVQLGDMPPGGGMPDAQKAILEAWISGGMPEGTAVDTLDEGVLDAALPDAALPDAAPDVAILDATPTDAIVDAAPPPTWDSAIGTLLRRATCTDGGCHSAASRMSGLDLSTYAGFLAGGLSGMSLHGDGNPANAHLINRLRARGFTVMPQGGPARPEAEIALIEAWISSGYPEN